MKGRHVMIRKAGWIVVRKSTEQPILTRTDAGFTVLEVYMDPDEAAIVARATPGAISTRVEVKATDGHV